MNILPLIQQVAFPLAMALYLLWFSLRYRRGQLPREGTFEWIFMRDKPRFSLQIKRGRMTRRDGLFLGVITAVYAAVAFFNLGNTTSPKSFYAFDTRGATVTIEFDEPLQMDTVFYYTGLYHADNYHGYKLYFSPDGIGWTQQTKEVDKPVRKWEGDTLVDTTERATVTTMTQQYSETFRWLFATLNPGQPDDTKFIRIVAESSPLELGELCLVEMRPDGTRATIAASRMTLTPGASALFDEPRTVPSRYDIQNSSHFDEIYHARTAYEFVRGVYPYETTHPPLGKLITAAGIKIFGMTPFGWRFMPTLFGVLMLPILYILIQWMFGKSFVSACGTLIFAFDFMHFVQTRISTIDVYAVFFILLMYLFMFRYITSGYDAPFRKTLLPLVLCGLSFGVGAAAKWVCIYAGLGLLALYVIYLVGRMRYAREHEQPFLPFLLLTLGASVFCFLLVPGVVYVACYIPYVLPRRPDPAGTPLLPEFSKFGAWFENVKQIWAGAWEECVSNQKGMFDYHGKGVLGSTHPYSSSWYQWVLDLRPILYYYNSRGAERASLSAFTNPLTTWAGLLALGACGVGVWKRRSAAALFIIIGYFSQLLPWLSIERITFSYHYFPSMIFIVLALCYVFHRTLEREPGAYKRIFVFTCAVLLMFIMFYPILSGTSVPSWYPVHFLKWFDSWTV